MKNGLLAIGQLSPRVIFSVNLSSNFIIFGTHIFKISKLVWCKFQPNPSKKEIAVGRASENTTVGNGHMGRANMFWTVKTFISRKSRMLRLYIYQI